MKKLLGSLIVIVQFLQVDAQVTDTLGFANFQLGTTALYASPNGGFAFGNNGYGDRVKAQSYYHENPFVLREVLLQFGDVNFSSEDSSSTVRVTVYDNHGVGITSFGTSDSIAPDSILAFVDVPVYSLVDDGTWSSADFSNDSLVIYARFSVGIDLSFLAEGDTVGLNSTTDGDASGTYNAWEMNNNGSWFTIEEPSYSWGLEVDLAIFPVIDDNDPASVSELGPTEYNIFPNPAIDHLSISFSKQATWNVSILAPTGQLLRQESVQGTAFEMDISELANGMYLVVLTNDLQAVSKPIFVVR